MKGRRADLSGAACAISRSLEIVGDWWSLLIVRDALLGFQRFSEFQKNSGMAKNILSARLKKLVDNGVLRLEPDERAPSRSKYVLTERGRGLSTVIAALWQWGADNCFEGDDPSLLLVEKDSGKPFGKLELKTADGQALDPQGVRMELDDRRKQPA